MVYNIKNLEQLEKQARYYILAENKWTLLSIIFVFIYIIILFFICPYLEQYNTLKTIISFIMPSGVFIILIVPIIKLYKQLTNNKASVIIKIIERFVMNYKFNTPQKKNELLNDLLCLGQQISGKSYSKSKHYLEDFVNNKLKPFCKI